MTDLAMPTSDPNGQPVLREGVPAAPRPRSTLTPVSWSPREREMPFAQWVEQGRRLGVMGRGAGWWIGDWLHYGNTAYGERYVRGARITGYDVQTLMNMTYVAARFDISRRREKLSWSHHAEVAALDPAHQDRLLARAEEERLSVRDVREEMRRERRLAAGELPEADPCADEEPVPLSPDHGDVVCPECGHAFLVEGERLNGNGHKRLPVAR
jgi:hypothetical protein